MSPAAPGTGSVCPAPVIAGDVAVAVGADAVFGLDVGSGEQVFAVDRELGPSAPAAVAGRWHRTAFVYTEGWVTARRPSPAPRTAHAVGGLPPAEVGSDEVVAEVDSELAASIWRPRSHRGHPCLSTA